MVPPTATVTSNPRDSLYFPESINLAFVTVTQSIFYKWRDTGINYSHTYVPAQYDDDDAYLFNVILIQVCQWSRL